MSCSCTPRRSIAIFMLCAACRQAWAAPGCDKMEGCCRDIREWLFGLPTGPSAAGCYKIEGPCGDVREWLHGVPGTTSAEAKYGNLTIDYDDDADADVATGQCLEYDVFSREPSLAEPAKEPANPTWWENETFIDCTGRKFSCKEERQKASVEPRKEASVGLDAELEHTSTHTYPCEAELK